jgi:general stress protein 26
MDQGATSHPWRSYILKKRKDQMNFTHAVVDDGDIIRKYRWSKREAKWYKDSHPDIDVIQLPKEEVKPFNTNDYEEAPY